MAIYFNGQLVSINGSLDTGAEPNYQTKSVTPTENAQQVTADDGYDALEQVNVGAISTTYVGTGIARNDSNSLSANGDTVTVPSGYYASQATKSVSSGSVTVKDITVSTAGLITAGATVTAGYVSGSPGNKTKQLTVQAGKTVTPSESQQTAVASGVYTTGAVIVGAIPSNYIGSAVTINKYYTGSSAPASSLGSNGDIYFMK